MDRDRRGVIARVAAGVAAALALLSAARVAAVGVRWGRAAGHAVRFGFRLVTLTAYRRCPACFRVVRREARVCRSCGAGTM